MIEWKGYWKPFSAPDREEEFLRELDRETGPSSPQHPLHGRRCRVAGRGLHRFAKPPTKDSGLKGLKNLILHLPADGRYAFVHLTWNEEHDPRWPNCRIFDKVEELNEFILSFGDG